MKGGKEGHLRGGLRGWKEGDIKGKAERGGGAATGEHSRARRRGTRACNCGPLWRNMARAAHGETLYRNFEWTNELGEKEEGRRRGAFGTWQTAPSTPGSERLSSLFLHSLLQKWQSGGDMDHPASGGPLKGELAERGLR